MKPRKSNGTVLRQGKAIYGAPEKEKLIVIEAQAIWLRPDPHNWAIGIPEKDAPVTKGRYLTDVLSKDGTTQEAIITLTKFFTPVKLTFNGVTYVLYRKGAFVVEWKKTGEPKPKKTNVQKRASASKGFHTSKLRARKTA